MSSWVKVALKTSYFTQCNEVSVALQYVQVKAQLNKIKHNLMNKRNTGKKADYNINICISVILRMCDVRRLWIVCFI